MLLGGIARLQGRIEANLGSATDATRIFFEAAHAIREIDPPNALEMAVLAAIMRTYGADSGIPWEAGDIDVNIDVDDPPRAVCLKQIDKRCGRNGDRLAGYAAFLDVHKGCALAGVQALDKGVHAADER